MREIHRITKPGGTVRIWVPHFSRGFTHAEHKSGFDVTFPYYFRATSSAATRASSSRSRTCACAGSRSRT